MADRFVSVLRRIAAGGIAGAIAGVVVAGVGGRIVMRAAAVLNPQATGARTENGELVGAITLNGTVALLLFSGLLTGVVAGIVWVVVSRWLPTGRWRLLAGAVSAAAIGGPLLIRSDNLDFRILEADGPILAMLIALVAVLGLAIAWLDDQLDRRLPRPDGRRLALGVVYGTITLLGLLFLPLAIGFYLSVETSGMRDPAQAVGWALVVAGLATAVAWAVHVRSGLPDPPAAVAAVGRVALMAAVILGTVRVADHVIRILG
ncbi:MAG TPA: hypothetical protein VFX65_00335 [Candidatus Limnocylindrales bacterium]|nr:hypothetical protein [Candidatus Limnocylindrales bacterium]